MGFVINKLQKKVYYEREAIRLKWEEFVNDARYKEYFMSDEDAWYDTLSKVKAYMDEHKSRPSQEVKIKRLKHWVHGLSTPSNKLQKEKSDYERRSNPTTMGRICKRILN